MLPMLFRSSRGASRPPVKNRTGVRKRIPMMIGREHCREDAEE
jgi:hypothetical protein